MRAVRHAVVADPMRGRLAVVRRSAALALATFAALVTLLLPAPGAARPVTVASDSVTSSGGVGSPETSVSGRRTDRGRTGQATASAGASWSDSVAGASLPGHTAAAAAGSAGAGPALVGTLPGGDRGETRHLVPTRVSWHSAAAASTWSGSSGSRAPPTA